MVKILEILSEEEMNELGKKLSALLRDKRSGFGSEDNLLSTSHLSGSCVQCDDYCYSECYGCVSCYHGPPVS